MISMRKRGRFTKCSRKRFLRSAKKSTFEIMRLNEQIIHCWKGLFHGNNNLKMFL